MKTFWLSLVVLIAASVVAGAALRAPPREERKQLAGAPSEFQSMAIPEPSANAVRADYGYLPVELEATRQGHYEYASTFPVDSIAEFSLSVISPFMDEFSIYLQPPGSAAYTLLDPAMFNGPDSMGHMTTGPYGIDGAVFTARTYTLPDPLVGTWGVKVVSSKALPQKPGLPDAFLILNNQSPFKLLSHLSTYDLQLDQQVGVQVQMYDSSDFPDHVAVTATNRPKKFSGAVLTAVLDVVLPNNETAQIDMHDDGLHADMEANDGVYGAFLEATQLGGYITRTTVRGTTPDGHAFLRSSNHYFPVVPPTATLTGVASAQLKDGVVSFFVDVDQPDAGKEAADATVRAYAEVWGSRPASGGASREGDSVAYDNAVPVAWVEAMADVVTVGSRMVVQLDMSEKWLQLAGAVAPLQLRNVVLQDRATNVLLSARSAVFVTSLPSDEEMSSLLQAHASFGRADIEITEEMRMGPRPLKYQRTGAEVAAGGKLVLVHGYCSGEVWPVEEFADAVAFTDLHQSRGQDEFAQKLLEFTSSLPSCGMVAHSQGGLAALHVKAYYWSCLDAAAGERKIQTVGSPWKGCSLAGSLADIGEVFGTGCGKQSDLTPDGASLWLSKIPEEPRKHVWYYTTKYPSEWWLTEGCVTASNLVLKTPNDGTCEIPYSVLDGATNMGTKEKFCHTTGMRFPAQTYDSERNAEMSKAAAR